jgi:hypothetical protein
LRWQDYALMLLMINIAYEKIVTKRPGAPAAQSADGKRHRLKTPTSITAK